MPVGIESREVSEISPSKYIHIGGDEADSTLKEDYKYFMGRVSKIVEKHGKVPIGWDPTNYAPKKFILGIEAPLWSETLRNQEDMDYMIYLRVLGYAEIGWTPKEGRNTGEYIQRMKENAKRLELQGVNYYKDPSLWK